MSVIIEIEIFRPDEIGPGKFGQKQFLVRGLRDAYWTDDLAAAMLAIDQEVRGFQSESLT